MGQRIRAKGKIYVAGEPGEPLVVREAVGHVVLPDGRVLQVRRATLNAAANTANQELIPANAEAVPRILSMLMVAGATATDVTVKSHDGTTATAVGPLLANAANGGAVLPHNPHGWFQALDVNCSLVVTTGTGSAVGIQALFVEVPADAFDVL